MSGNSASKVSSWDSWVALLIALTLLQPIILPVWFVGVIAFCLPEGCLPVRPQRWQVLAELYAPIWLVAAGWLCLAVSYGAFRLRKLI